MRGAATDSYLPIAADHRVDKGEEDMILATTKVEDYERFLAIFSTKDAEKRGQHGSKGAAGHHQPLPTSRRPQPPAGSPAARPRCCAWWRGV